MLTHRTLIRARTACGRCHLLSLALVFATLLGCDDKRRQSFEPDTAPLGTDDAGTNHSATHSSQDASLEPSMPSDATISPDPTMSSGDPTTEPSSAAEPQTAAP
jgi:hypothetical protein